MLNDEISSQGESVADLCGPCSFTLRVTLLSNYSKSEDSMGHCPGRANADDDSRSQGGPSQVTAARDIHCTG